ncbi:uncharacterized protein [Palaemon carinicauda]|uniref:uncharacterized protein n=1 Tax=Palaemon carinicauda TaxID=392227 RepID=UPI0035B57F10
MSLLVKVVALMALVSYAQCRKMDKASPRTELTLEAANPASQFFITVFMAASVYIGMVFMVRELTFGFLEGLAPISLPPTGFPGPLPPTSPPIPPAFLPPPQPAFPPPPKPSAIPPPPKPSAIPPPPKPSAYPPTPQPSTYPTPKPSALYPHNIPSNFPPVVNPSSKTPSTKPPSSHLPPVLSTLSSYAVLPYNNPSTSLPAKEPSKSPHPEEPPTEAFGTFNSYSQNDEQGFHYIGPFRYRALESNDSLISQVLKSIDDPIESAFGLLRVEERVCKERVVCELQRATSTLPIVGSLLKYISPSIPGLGEYQEAQDAGAALEDCALLFSECPYSLLS